MNTGAKSECDLTWSPENPSSEQNRLVTQCCNGRGGHYAIADDSRPGKHVARPEKPMLEQFVFFLSRPCEGVFSSGSGWLLRANSEIPTLGTVIRPRGGP